MSSIRTQLRQQILDFGIGMYVQDPDNQSFTPIRWEDSPLIDEYVDAILKLISEERNKAKAEFAVDLNNLLQGLNKKRKTTKSEQREKLK